jgi:PAS domain S-box-containing protein
MKGQNKTKADLFTELAALRRRVAELEAQDIEHRRTEQALREDQDRYRSFVQQSSEAIWCFEHDQPVPVDLPEDEQIDRMYQYSFLAECNDAMARMYGFARAEEMVGKRLGEFVLRSDPNNIEYLRAFIRSGYRLTDAESHEVDRDGQPKYFLNHLVGIVEQGCLVRAWGTQRDITERKQLEDQLRQAQKMEAIGRLAGGVAHDFNNLLTVISGYSELMRNSLGPGDPRRGYVEEIRNASTRAAGLTRQLLAFSRQQVLQPRVLNLNTIVANMERLLRRLIGEDIELTTLLDSDLGQVKADPGQIEQVILNLAINARDAMPQGGRLTLVTANIDLGKTEAGLGVPTGRHAMLAVSDTGCGMDVETKSHLFEPFFTTKAQGKGTGLGLPTVYGIITQSDGHIWVDSEVGQGTVFRIYLPRVDQAPDALSLSDEASRLPIGTETVLLVEDDPSVRELTARVLGEQGYVVLATANGQEALRVAEKHSGNQIRLLLTDVVMPQMNGRELAERMRAQHPHVKVLYLSGYLDDTITNYGVLGPGVSFLHKPFTSAALARLVREVLDK